MSEINDRLTRLLLAGTDRLRLPLSVHQVQALAREVAKELEPAAEVPALTPREIDTLVGLFRNESSAETARQLFVSESTVKNHRTHLYRKLGVTSSGEAVAYAVRCGLLRDEPLALLTAGVSA